MHFSRPTRTWCSRWLIASLLFMQLASGAYACAMTSLAAKSPMAGMPCAQAMAEGGMSIMDPDQLGLCFEHCKGGSQTKLEPGSTAGFAMPALVALFVVTVPSQPARTAATQAQWHGRESARPPPHAILHCCLRI